MLSTEVVFKVKAAGLILLWIVMDLDVFSKWGLDMDWMFVLPSPKSYAETLVPNVTICGDGALGGNQALRVESSC